MAPRKIDRSKVPPDMLAKAREAALAKQARLMAEAELGIGDNDLPVQKGPLTDEGDIIPVYINLADYADRITLDGVIYINGRTYDLPERKAQVVHEICARSWRHQAEIEGKDSEFYLRQQLTNRAVSANLSTLAQRVRVSV